MEVYSEYYGGNRKATVTLINRSWDPRFNVWEVAMYEGYTVVQRRTLNSESDAEILAEDFVNSGSSSSVLLNESK